MAIGPDNTRQAVVDALERQGLDVATYKADDDADRMRVVREQASEETRFSVENGEEVKKNDFRSIDKRDKEELAEVADYILGNDYAAELTGEEFPKGETKLKDAVVDYYRKNYANQVTRDGFGVVFLDERAVKDDLSHGVGANKAIAFAAVPEVIKDGTLVDVNKNWKGKKNNSYIIVAPIKIDNEEYVEAVVVRGGKEKKRLYLHEITLIERSSLPDGSITTSLKLEDSHQGDIAKVLRKIINAKDEVENLRKNNEESNARFSIDDEKKTLVGVHNISEEKLREALKDVRFGRFAFRRPYSPF